MNRAQVKTWMLTNLVDFVDECGEINTTALAENAADVFDLYEDKVDYEIKDEVFDLAFVVAEENFEVGGR